MAKQNKSVKRSKTALGYSLERLVWCVAAIAMCWTEVQNYHEYIFLLRIGILSGVGAFYCVKLGFFEKRKRGLCGGITIGGILLTVILVKSNFYAYYRYLNIPIGILITVLANFYALVLWDFVKERKTLRYLGPSVLLAAMLLAKQFSVFDYRRFYLYILVTLLPFMLMRKEENSREDALNGMIDGMCIGFFLTQGYAWMHRPYNYSFLRYTGISNATTTMSRIYVAFYAAWIIRYTQIARLDRNLFRSVAGAFSWLVAAFVLALEYLTGSRSSVLAMILMTGIAVAVRYISAEDKGRQKVKKLLLWPLNCACMGLVSLALFPVAYQSVRYLPAYFNEPVYVDSIGYRLDSVPIQKWGENFGWNYEYDEYAVKVDEDMDSPKYATYEESVSHNLGRIIPGADVYLEKVLAEKLLQSSLARTDHYLEMGIYDQEQHYKYTVYWNWLYDPVREAEKTAGSVWESNNILIRSYTSIVEMLLKSLVLRTDAAEGAKMAALPGRGDSAETPWFTKEEFPGYGMELREAIHQYAISKLNMEGHTAGSFQVWVTEEESHPHAHNIFLIAGYDFGIPTMILMILFFVSVFLAAMYNVIRFGKTEYLLPALLVAGITVFGWFEIGFDYKTGIMAWIFLSAVFTDVLSKKKAT